MYVIVVGAGNIGRPLVEIATGGGHEVVVIEHDHNRAVSLAGDFDCLVLEADATIQETLVEAGADEADAIISTTDHDATNIMVCLLAQELDIPQLVSVVHRPEDIPVFHQIGVHAMENPQRLIAQYLYRAVHSPAVRDHMRIGEHAEIFEIEVTDDAPIAGRTLQEANERGLLPGEVLVVAIDRPGAPKPLVPRGETRLQAGDCAVIYSTSGAEEGIVAAFDATDS